MGPYFFFFLAERFVWAEIVNWYIDKISSHSRCDGGDEVWMIDDRENNLKHCEQKPITV